MLVSPQEGQRLIIVLFALQLRSSLGIIQFHEHLITRDDDAR